ncbi:MAG: glycosyltransferase family 39 protein [Candidatus Saccharimonadales bacterium]
MRRKITDYMLYRWRFYLGYGAIGVTLVGLLVVAALYIPGALSTSEMSAVVASSAITFDHFDPAVMIQLPYHLLQQVSLILFGVTNLSIKLPSLILGVGSALGILLLLRSWFSANVAVLTTILVITTSQFLAIAQSGTPSIVYVFWSVWLLVAALRVSRQDAHAGLWKIVLFSVAALSLYTPLSVYILVALASATVFHPHLRYLAKRAIKARGKVAVASICALLLVVPLGIGIYMDPSLGLRLLGVPSTWPNITESAHALFNQYFNFLQPTTGTLMQPIYSLGPLLLIVLGLIRLFTANYTARSYIIIAWTVLLVPVLLLNPDYTSVTFVPAMILMAMGVNALLSSWYKLFPKNPYARIVGLVPLTILIGGMVVSGVGRYVYSYTYDPQTAGFFSHDLQLLNRDLRNSGQNDVTLIVSEFQKPFYDVVAKHHNLQIVVSTSQKSMKLATYSIVTRDNYRTTLDKQIPYRIVTDGRAEFADRFYVYKTKQE